jgi:hypothetical protein
MSGRPNAKREHRDSLLLLLCLIWLSIRMDGHEEVIAHVVGQVATGKYKGEAMIRSGE